jgi:hypothetical protein
MLVIGVCTRNRDHTSAYFFCPVCRSRKHCTQGSRSSYFSLFFLPLIPLATLGEYYRCEGCQKLFDPDAKFPFDFGDHANPRLWECTRCHSMNPSHAFRCQVCGLDG